MKQSTNIVELPNRYHFIGIGGIGMSGLAKVLLQKNIPVSGSDLSASYITQSLEKLGAKIYLEHSEDNITEPSVIIYSSAILEDNPEMRAGKRRGCPFLHRSELLDELMHNDAPLLVTGTHGKTTTSALLAHLLIESDLHPSFIIGGMIKGLDTNSNYGLGPYFVAEADESDGSFLKYNAFGSIITNIDDDHFDYWKTRDSLIRGFKQFAEKVNSPEHLFWCGDDDIVHSLHLKGVSYGFEEENDLRILSFRQNGWSDFFDVHFEGKKYPEIEIPLIGGHNVLNAASVFGMGLRINIPEEKIRSAFASFKGVTRRLDFKGECKSISIYDDYAHHPTEIYATLRAMKHAVDKQRLVVVFQPHRFTRTFDCFAEFGPAFAVADMLILTDIFSAGEKPIENITTEMLLKKIKQTYKGDVRYCKRADLSAFICSILKENDVLVTMGAGDITKVGPEVIAHLKQSIRLPMCVT